jgi:lipoprotein-releasing system permease protein
MIATGGVTVGVMALVVVLGVMNGLQNELRDRILIGSAHVQIFTYGAGLRVDDWRVAIDTIRKHQDVEAAAPFVLMQGLITKGADWSEGVIVRGIDPDTGTTSVTTLPQHFLQGDLRFRTHHDGVDGGIILGRRVAERLQAFPEDRVTLLSAQGIRFNRALGAFVPSFHQYEVVGEFETGMYEYDNGYVVMGLEDAQKFAGLDSAVSGIEVRLRDPWIAKEVGRELAETLAFPYRAVDWQTQNANLFSALKLEKLAMGLVLLLIVVVAAFNIVGTLTMVVTDKTKEIGILRAMGLPARKIRAIFVLQGTLIGLVGTVIGTGLGIVVGYVVGTRRLITIPAEVYFIDHLPIQMQVTDTLTVVLASLLVAVLATIYPSRRAAALVPVEAIRYQ